MKEANPLIKSCLAVLYYKTDPVTSENSGSCNGTRNGTRQNTQTLWKKASEQESLQEAVGKIRPFLEVLLYCCTDPEEQWTSLPWLELAISRGESQNRLFRIFTLVKTLMRSSEWGPDAPVHWAAHPSLNHYPRSTITAELMTELVVGLANILIYLFLCHPVTVNNLEGVKKCLPKFKTLGVGTNAKKPSPKGLDAARPPTTTKGVPSMDPLVINLSGLSIKD